MLPACRSRTAWANSPRRARTSSRMGSRKVVLPSTMITIDLLVYVADATLCSDRYAQVNGSANVQAKPSRPAHGLAGSVGSDRVSLHLHHHLADVLALEELD